MKDNKIPSPLVSLLPVFVLILLLFVTIRTFGSDAFMGHRTKRFFQWSGKMGERF